MIFKSLLLLSLTWSHALSEVLVPAGKFKPAFQDLGEDQVQVQALFVDTAPVTNEEYMVFLKKNPVWQKNKISKLYADASYLSSWQQGEEFSPKKSQHPVVNISWFAAREYCAFLGKRLPTIAEWEYFSEANMPGYEEKALQWYSKAREDIFPVRQGGPNSFGLYDTHSLVWEWVEDYASVFMMADSRQGFAKNMFCAGAAVGARDPSKYATFVRYAMRSSLKGNFTGSRLGFRCVKEKGK